MFLESLKLKNEIDYNDKNIESKILLEDGERRILLLALKKGQILPEHFSPVVAAICVIEGKITFKADGDDYELTVGEMFIVPANKNHEVVANENSKFIVIRL